MKDDEIWGNKQMWIDFCPTDFKLLRFLMFWDFTSLTKIFWKSNGAGFSDSMILNALQCSTLPFAVSLDSDLAYSVMANPSLKDVLMPDELIF